METFKQEYVQKCLSLGVDPSPTILNHLSLPTGPKESADDKLRDVLNLSAHPLSIKGATALAAALSESALFTRLIVADAFLGDDGCIIIASALKTNTSVTHLDMRGNNIRSDGATALAQMLKVNTTLKSLMLEWNCIGIWETGVKALADALSINQSLEELDLRNNKIGPQGCQSLAFCLKHNTSLKRLDLRWNNAGVIGGRAFVDLMKWNMVLVELDLTGNEIPEDVAKSLIATLERNRNRQSHELQTRLHSNHLSATLQALNMSHQESISQMTTKLQSSDAAARSLTTKLDLASQEIQAGQEQCKMLEVKLARVAKEKEETEMQLIHERKATREKLEQLQKEVAMEREKRTKSDELFQKSNSELSRKSLELEAKLQETEVKFEVLKKDKAILLEDASKAKEREKSIFQMWEEKLQRQEATHQKKMQALDESKDVEMNERVRKLEERIRQLEHDKTQADQNFDSMKAKLVSEKRHLLDQMSEAESRHQRDEELKRKELEEQIEYLKHQNAQLQQTLTTQINTYNQSLLDRETENKRHQDLRIQLQEQLADMKAQLTTVQSELGHMRQRCEDARRSEHSQQENIAALNTQMLKLREDHGKVELNLQMQIEKLTALMNQKDLLIARLKDEIRKREDELDEIEEGQALKMKELQVSIGSLLSARGRRPRKASPSLEPS